MTSPLQGRLEAVIWDFGGVLTSSPFEAFNRFEVRRGLPRDFIRTVNATNPNANAWALFERAEVGEAEFDVLFAADSRALGHEIRGRDVLPLLSGELRPRVISALDVVAQHFRTGCITNNVAAGVGPGMARAVEKAGRIADVMARFGHVIESSKVGIRKPDPRIYALMCEALGVAPSACVYLDDLGINLKPARDMGMMTIKVESEPQLLLDLSRATGLDLGP